MNYSRTGISLFHLVWTSPRLSNLLWGTAASLLCSLASGCQSSALTDSEHLPSANADDSVEQEPDCAASWRELQALHTAMAKVEGAPIRMPSENDYLTTCKGLSKAAIPCLSPSYRVNHLESCRETWGQIPKKDRKRLQRSLGSPSSP